MTLALPAALKRFIWDLQSVAELADSPREIMMIGGDLSRELWRKMGDAVRKAA